jgi:hypothetical protein
MTSWPNAVCIQAKHIIYSLEFLPRNCCNLTAGMQCTPNTNFFIMKREFVNKSWIFCTTIPIGLRIHLSTEWKQASSVKNTNCGSTSPSCTDQRNKLQKCILATGSRSFKALTTVVLHGRGCNNFVAIHADVFETLSWAEKFSATFFSRHIFEVQLH